MWFHVNPTQAVLSPSLCSGQGAGHASPQGSLARGAGPPSPGAGLPRGLP